MDEDNVLILQIAFSMVAGDVSFMSCGVQERVALVADVYRQLKKLTDGDVVVSHVAGRVMS